MLYFWDAKKQNEELIWSEVSIFVDTSIRGLQSSLIASSTTPPHATLSLLKSYFSIFIFFVCVVIALQNFLVMLVQSCIGD